MFLDAINGEKTDRIPIWFMRQAGRYLPEYQEIRVGKTFEDISQNPDYAVEITLQPVNRFKLDAAIIFSDILIPLYSMDRSLTIKPGLGPIIKNPIRKPEDIANLSVPNPNIDYPYLAESIHKVRSRLNGTALIGFSGGPFTLASYLIEGKSTKDAHLTKVFAYKHRKAYKNLMKILVETIIEQLKIQVDNGADVIQIFDTWAGHLSLDQYRQLALPYTQEILKSSRLANVPKIHFARGAGHLYRAFLETGANTISIDTSIEIRDILPNIPSNISISGNLDPAILETHPKFVKTQVKSLLQDVNKRHGYIFNLGKGISKTTPLESVETMVKTVKNYKWS